MEADSGGADLCVSFPAVASSRNLGVSSTGEQRIYANLTDIFRDIFADQALELTAATSAAEIAGWDSFAQINIIVAAEARFGVRFRSSEAQSLRSVGDLVRVIQLKQAKI